MRLYTLYPCLSNGSSTAFETAELPEDLAAIEDRALQALRDHPTATYVAVWDEDRAIGEFHAGHPVSHLPIQT